MKRCRRRPIRRRERRPTFSSTQRVWTFPATKSGCVRMARRNGMLVAMPSSRNSLSARVARPNDRGEIRRWGMRDDLGQQRIERPAGTIPRVAEPVRPHARPASAPRRPSKCRPPAARSRPFSDRFHVDARSGSRSPRGRRHPLPLQPQSPAASRPGPAVSGSARDRRRSPPPSPCARPEGGRSPR